MRHCCRNCHFLAKEHTDRTGRSLSGTWSAKERESMKIEDYYVAKCAEGIWDTGIDPNLRESLHEILRKNRKGDCFFIEVQQGMLFPAARKLHRTRNENRNQWRSHRYAQWGLLIAAISLITSVVYWILED